MLGELSCNVQLGYPTIDVMPSMLPKSHWEQFGAWLRKMRRNADLTQKQVAERSGIHEVQLARIEKGESGTKRETVILLAQAIGIDRSQALQNAGFSLTEYPIFDEEAEGMAFSLAHRGYEIVQKKPTNAAEFLEALEKMGVPGLEVMNLKGIHNLTPDEYQNLLRDLSVAVEIALRRIAAEHHE